MAGKAAQVCGRTGVRPGMLTRETQHPHDRWTLSDQRSGRRQPGQYQNTPNNAATHHNTTEPQTNTETSTKPRRRNTPGAPHNNTQ